MDFGYILYCFSAINFFINALIVIKINERKSKIYGLRCFLFFGSYLISIISDYTGFNLFINIITAILFFSAYITDFWILCLIIFDKRSKDYKRFKISLIILLISMFFIIAWRSSIHPDVLTDDIIVVFILFLFAFPLIFLSMRFLVQLQKFEFGIHQRGIITLLHGYLLNYFANFFYLFSYEITEILNIIATFMITYAFIVASKSSDMYREVEMYKENSYLKKNLQVTSSKYTQLVESSIFGVFLIRKNKLVFCNDRFCEIMEISKKESMSWTIRDILEKLPTPKVDSTEDRFAGIIPESNIFELPQVELETKIYPKENLKKYVLIYGNQISSNEKKLSQYIIIDQTEKKIAMEERDSERLRIQKSESISLFAGGIAHDFNNILVSILGNVDYLAIQQDFKPEIMEIIGDCREAAERAKDLVSQLLTFSKEDKKIRKSASIVDIVRNSVSLIMRGSNSSCEFVKIGENIPNININKTQITQVINNLLINAKEAMPGGGLISIVIKTVMVAEKDSLTEYLTTGKYIKIIIKDQGKGIPQKIQKDIFSPYFTTKSTGSGLGLAITYSIISKHNGFITFNSQENVGTEFFVYLPVNEIQTDETIKSKSPFKQEDLKGKRILIMDDDKNVQKILSLILKHLGIEVESVYDGESAISLLKRRDNKFDAIIMDLTIVGGLGGAETIQKIREFDENILAIVSSGYSNNPNVTNFKNHGFNARLSKPFTIDQLKEVLSSIF